MSNKNNLQPASGEVLDEFERVRERFLTTFDSVTHDSMPTIDAYFDEKGLYRHPSILVPFTPEGFAAAKAISTETKYPLPFVTTKYTRRTNFLETNGPGDSYSVPAYRLNVISDTSKRMAEQYGEVFTERIVSTLFAHEIAHSVFHANPTILASDEGTLYERYPLSGMLHKIYDKNNNYYHRPMWSEEAFAVYVSADVFKKVIPKQKGTYYEWYKWGPDPFWLDGHYLAYAPQYPDQPGTISGAVAGQTLEILDRRVPGTIDKMFGIARGEVDAEKFRADMRRQVGDKLFGMMFKRHPYTDWASIYGDVLILPIPDQARS